MCLLLLAVQKQTARPGVGVASTSCDRPLLTAGKKTGTTALTSNKMTGEEPGSWKRSLCLK